jgi:hypothetical protein
MYQLNPSYIVGLVDGEGSFTVYVNLKNNLNRRVRVEPKFYIKLTEEDKEILHQVQKFFKCGSVYFQKDTRPNHKNCYRYEVYNRDDINKVIIPFFKQNELKFSTKKRDFKIFCELVEMINKNDHLNNQGLKKMFDLKQTMH